MCCRDRILKIAMPIAYLSKLTAKPRTSEANLHIGIVLTIVAGALNAPPATAVELNLRIRNSSLTEFASTPRRHHLVSFNGLPHLDTNSDPTLTTYA